MFKQLGAEWPWLERELLCSFGQLVLHSVNKDSSGLVLGAQQHCNMDTFLIKKRANKELSIIQGGKTLDFFLSPKPTDRYAVTAKYFQAVSEVDLLISALQGQCPFISSHPSHLCPSLSETETH